VSVTGAANPLTRVIVIVAVPLVPCCTVTGDGATESAMPGAVELNVAVTLVPKFGSVGIVQVSAVPVHPPAQLTNALPADGAAVSVMGVPAGNCLKHVPPQLMPAGSDVTIPDPEPTLFTVRPGARVIVTVRVWSEKSLLPSLPRTCIGKVPTPARRAAWMVSVLEPLLNVVALSVAVMLSGAPETESDTAPFGFPTIDTVTVPVWPWERVRLEGESETL